MIVMLNLSAETAKRLGDRAAREGKTLKVLLQDLAEQEASDSGGSCPKAQEDEERPWRGVFVLDYPQRELLTAEREVNVNALPSLPPEMLIDLERLADDSK